jgi:CRP-like cAMP-binding protein
MNLDSSAFVADQELIQALRERARGVDCSYDRVLFHQGDEPTGLYLVLSGEIIMTMESLAGDEVVSLRADPGSLLGLPGLVGNTGYSLSAWARKGAEIGFVSRDDFSSLMLSKPNMGMLILKVLAREVRSARMAITGR